MCHCVGHPARIPLSLSSHAGTCEQTEAQSAQGFAEGHKVQWGGERGGDDWGMEGHVGWAQGTPLLSGGGKGSGLCTQWVCQAEMWVRCERQPQPLRPGQWGHSGEKLDFSRRERVSSLCGLSPSKDALVRKTVDTGAQLGCAWPQGSKSSFFSASSAGTPPTPFP